MSAVDHRILISSRLAVITTETLLLTAGRALINLVREWPGYRWALRAQLT